MHLSYHNHIPADDLLGRLLGPDALGGYLVVTAVEHQHQPGDPRTVARCRPVGPAEMNRRLTDEYGQLWLATDDDPYPHARRQRAAAVAAGIEVSNA